jgi:hypothetical protein
MIDIKKKLIKVKAYIIKLIGLQLLLTNIVLPFTIYWGMSISPLSIISTIIGSPLVFLIIIMTGINYLLITVNIKINFLFKILDFICFIWQKFINTNLDVPLIVIPSIPMELIFILTIIYVLIYYKYKDKQNNAIMISFFYFLTILCISHLCHKLPDSIQTDKINLQYNKLSKKLTLIIGKIPKNYSDWHFRTVLPLIRKNYGKNSVDIIKIKKINKTVEKYLNEINKEKFYLELIVEQEN